MNRQTYRNIILVSGPLLFFIFTTFIDLDPSNRHITQMAGIVIWMAIWWITEVIPLGITALLPIILYPLLGIMSGKGIAPIYFNNIIFLFIGGFMVAIAMERWNLHKRIALQILMHVGTSLRTIILGFMLATWFLSMWISNTATTMMMIPIALAIILKLEESIEDKIISNFSIGLLLGVAYSASIGGIATLVGTPPNLSFVKIFSTHFPQAVEISFTQWFIFALPLSVVFFILVWLFLVIRFTPPNFRVDSSTFHDEYRKLGPIAYEEKIVLIDFILLAVLWLTRSNLNIGAFTIPGWSSLMIVPGFIDDGTVAIFMATILFLIPSRKISNSTILDWQSASKLPWNIVLLFGGGFALASGFLKTGLSEWIGTQLTILSGLSPILIVLIACTLVTFLTELTSNTATVQVILPIIASLAVAIKINPLLLMIPVTLSASCAFMLPVATPPNAIIFGTGRIKVIDMAKTGILINLLGIILISIIVFTMGRAIFGIDSSIFPFWAQ